MAALFEDAMDGGVVVCQEAGCMLWLRINAEAGTDYDIGMERDYR